MAIETPAREKRTKEFGLQAWFIRWYVQSRDTSYTSRRDLLKLVDITPSS